MNRRALINGRPGETIDVDDRGLQYGDGLFETMAVVHGEIRRLALHLNRLEAGCARLGIPCPHRDRLTDELACFAESEHEAVLKLVLTRGVGARGFQSHESIEPTRIVTLHDWPARPAHWRETGVAARWCTTTLAAQPLLAGIKHLNRLEYILARREWTDPKVAEGLLRDTDGHLICGTMSNVFVVHGNELATPRLDRCGVVGTVRSSVLCLADQVGMRAMEKELTPDDVVAAQEVFLTNALIGIWPVNRVDERILPVGQIARQLQELLG